MHRMHRRDRRPFGFPPPPLFGLPGVIPPEDLERFVGNALMHVADSLADVLDSVDWIADDVRDSFGKFDDIRWRDRPRGWDDKR